VLSADVKPDVLDQLSRLAPREGLLSPSADQRASQGNGQNAEQALASSVFGDPQNIARHPNSDAATLTRLSRDRSQPLWYLVAFNPNAPSPLRKKLQERMRRLARNPPLSRNSDSQIGSFKLPS